jgi:hypothetical protein
MNNGTGVLLLVAPKKNPAGAGFKVKGGKLRQ